MNIKLPQLGEGADSGTIVTIFVKEGDVIKANQNIVELENEKAVAPIPSPQAGRVTKILVKVGQKVSVGQSLVGLDPDGGSSKTIDDAPAKDAAVESSAEEDRRAAKIRMAAAQSGDFVYKSESGLPPPAAPSVRKIARELGIDLGRVKGSAAGGRIVTQDLKAYVQKLQSGVSTTPGQTQTAVIQAPVDFSKWGPVHKETLSGLRKTIGRRMTESWTSIPHVTQFDEADITNLMKLRKKLAASYEKKGARLTLTSFALKAALRALEKHPLFCTSLDEASGELVYKEYIHMGIAVDTDQGLIVPVIRDVGKKSLLDLSKELQTVSEKTRARKMTAEELKGGTFTISNLGSIGGTHFTPIINKPEVAILGLGRGTPRPVMTKGPKKKIEERILLPLALSYDHRVIDGAAGARFIRTVVEAFENFNEKDAGI